MIAEDIARRSCDNLAEGKGEHALEQLLRLDSFFQRRGAAGFLDAVVSEEGRGGLVDKLPAAAEGFRAPENIDRCRILAMHDDVVDEEFGVVGTTERLSEEFEKIVGEFFTSASMRLWNPDAGPWQPFGNLDAVDDRLNEWLTDHAESPWRSKPIGYRRDFSIDREAIGASFDCRRSIGAELSPRVRIFPTRRAYRRLNEIERPLREMVEQLGMAAAPVASKVARNTDIDAMFARSASAAKLSEIIATIQAESFRVNILTTRVPTKSVIHLDASPYESGLRSPEWFNTESTFQYFLPGVEVLISASDEPAVVCVPSDDVDHIPITLKTFDES